MRCGQAQKLMTAAVDSEITTARRRDLDAHVAACAECRDELRATEALFAALGRLPQEAEVPALVESATIRRMRIAAAEERERKERRWAWLPVPVIPVLAAAGVVTLALVITLRPGGEGRALRPATPDTSTPLLARAADPTPTPAAPKRGTTVVAEVTPPSEPPPDLAAAPELFMNLPVIRSMEKLEHFEAISMVELVPNG